ncbi:hypothetical protein [Actinophytocola sp. NPDC049390]|uniref:hypothetical protein n=1 Tax=Actinophytocola sp. NPDC049390 TaxID=3363894 RepID=UPI0037A93EAE
MLEAVHRTVGPTVENDSMCGNTVLLAGHWLSDRLEELRQTAQQHLMNWDPDDFLTTPETDVVKQLLSVADLDAPTLRRDEAYLLEPTEANQRSRGFDQIPHRATTFVLAVPFDGNPEVFSLKVGSAPRNPLRGDIGNGELRLFCTPNGGHAATVKASFDTQLDVIEQSTHRAKDDIDQHRRRLATEIPKLVADRRTKLLTDRELHANIGFPIKRRPDAGTYAVPVRRRQVALERRPTDPAQPRLFEPEPVLVDADYEAALAVLRSTRNALERSPSTTRHLGEEQIRDVLLVSLNAQFEGTATGEVFNGAGKTDILIRVDDRNVFIGECKIWNGPQTVTKALDQLVGYLVWRDTKAALLLFIRDANVSTVAAKAVAKIEDHPNYKRRGKTFTEERYDFVLHARDDRAREIHLALVPFLIAKKSQPTRAACGRRRAAR